MLFQENILIIFLERGAHLGTGKEAVHELEEIQASRENLDRDQDHNRSFLHPVIMFMFSFSPARCTSPCKLYCTAFMYFHLVNNSSPVDFATILQSSHLFDILSSPH